MKKIIILVLLLFPISIKAKTIAFESEVINSNSLLQESDELKFIGSKKLYNSYVIEKEDYGYMEINTDYLIDWNDSLRLSAFYPGEKNIDSYKHIKGNDFFISSITINSNEDYNVKEIEIYQYSRKVNCKFTSSNLDYKKLNDNLYDESVNLKNNSITIEFDYLLSLNNLEIVIKSDDLVEHTLNINYLDNEDNYSSIVAISDYNSYHIGNDLDESTCYQNDITHLFRHYKENKVISNVYKESGDNLIYDDYINQYYYQKYDLITLYDDYNRLDDLIKETNFEIENYYIVYDNDIFSKTGHYDVDIYINDYYIVLEYDVEYDDFISDKFEDIDTNDNILTEEVKVEEDTSEIKNNVPIKDEEEVKLPENEINNDISSNNVINQEENNDNIFINNQIIDEKSEYVKEEFENSNIEEEKQNKDEIYIPIKNVEIKIPENEDSTYSNEQIVVPSKSVSSKEENKYSFLFVFIVEALLCIVALILYIRNKSKNVEDVL